MAKTYQLVDTEVLELLDEVMCKWHPRLRDAGVRVGVLMPYDADGPALKHGGYPAVAKIKPLNLKERQKWPFDAELEIDEREWKNLLPAQRLALLDHELSHIDTIDLKPDELRDLRRENPGAPSYRVDDNGRPKLKSVPGDWNTGDGFHAVVARHGGDAIEYLNIAAAKAAADAARRFGEAERQLPGDSAA